MPNANEQHLRSCLHLADQMLSLAEKADADRTDDSCGILWGILRDMAYRLRREVEKQLRMTNSRRAGAAPYS